MCQTAYRFCLHKLPWNRRRTRKLKYCTLAAAFIHDFMVRRGDGCWEQVHPQPITFDCIWKLLGHDFSTTPENKAPRTCGTYWVRSSLSWTKVWRTPSAVNTALPPLLVPPLLAAPLPLNIRKRWTTVVKSNLRASVCNGKAFVYIKDCLWCLNSWKKKKSTEVIIHYSFWPLSTDMVGLNSLESYQVTLFFHRYATIPLAHLVVRADAFEACSSNISLRCFSTRRSILRSSS